MAASFKLFDKVWLFTLSNSRITIYTGSIIEMPSDFNVEGWVRYCKVSTKYGDMSATSSDLVHYGDYEGMANMFNRSAVGLQSQFNSDMESAKATMETLVNEAKEQECPHSTR